MIRGVVRCSSLALCTLVCSCTLFVDPDRFAQQSPPISPQVTVTPEAPGTLDPLVAHFEMEPDVTYTVEWTCERNGSARECPAAVTGPTLSAGNTAKRQRWTASLTASLVGARGGMLSGAPSVSEPTEIVNTPPTLISAAVSTYRAFVGETLTVNLVGAEDPDLGDDENAEIEWLVGDTVVSTGLAFNLSGQEALIGEDLMVRAGVSDGEAASENILVGPVRVSADVTAWRQLRPSPLRSLPIFDPVHERMVYFDLARGGVWEGTLLPTTVRFAQLNVTGSARPSSLGPFATQQVVYATQTHEAIIFDNPAGVASTRVLRLSLGDRGRESIREVAFDPEAASRPTTFVNNEPVYDATTHSVHLFGGVLMSDGATLLSDLWTFHLDDERWEHRTVVPSVADLVLVAAAAVMHPDGDRILIFGGAQVPSGSLPVPALGVWELSLNPDPSGNLPLRPLERPDGSGGTVAVALDEGRLAMSAALTPDETAVLVGLGSGNLQLQTGAFEPVSPTAWLLDLATNELTRLATDEATTVASAGGVLGFHKGSGLDGDAALFMAAGEFAVFALEDWATAPTWNITLRDWITQPGALVEAFTSRNLLMGGLRDDGTLNDAVWQLTPSAQWVGGSSVPETARRGLASSGASFYAGGSNAADVALGNMDVYDDGFFPNLYQPRVTSPVPEPRTNHALEGGACGVEMVIYGGRLASGSRTDQLWFLDCIGPSFCTWSNPSFATAPGNRILPGLSSVGDDLILFGGAGSFGSTNELWALRDCSDPSAAWEQVVNAGTPPAARSGHTMNRISLVSSSDEFLLVAGGDVVGNPSDMDAFLLRRSLLDGALTWIPIDAQGTPPGRRDAHAAIWDDAGQRLLIYGGVTPNVSDAADLWELRVRSDVLP